MLHLRVLTMSDWPLWREVRLAALSEAPHAFKAGLAEWHNGGEERWRERLAMPATYSIVTLLDGRAVGMAAGLPGDGGACQLRSVWVSPQARGHSVGDQLIAAVEGWARQRGATTLKLAVLPGNEPAVALYQRNGFIDTGELGDLLPDGVTRERLMVKVLR
ncbi:GNAT family N-acetyltransferase [Streptomyces nogalater]|uniref:GNAT family N-acetyltransferase n=1 Tax=Streptomyces nogalater TaxID=38314 RepID=A0ABW0WFP4_STRNO